MAETTLNAPGFSATWATVRLEPTQIGARGGPAFPELLIPLYVTLQSVEPQQHYNAYFPTGDDPIQHFSLLQLSGSLVINSTPIGAIPATLTSLNTYNSRSSAITLFVPLDMFRVHYIEQRRVGDITLQLTLTPWIAVHKQAPRKDAVSGYERFEVGYFTLSVQIPQSHWIQQILPQLGYGKIQLIEVPIPENAIGEGLTKTVSELQHAQDAIQFGDYHKALGLCRKAIELLSNILPYKGEKERPSFADKIDFLLNALPGTPTGVRRDNLARMFKDIWGFTSIPEHPSPLLFSRNDAQMTLVVVTALLSYMSDFVHTAQQK